MVEELKRKVIYLSEDLDKRSYVWETGTSCGSLEIPLFEIFRSSKLGTGGGGSRAPSLCIQCWSDGIKFKVTANKQTNKQKYLLFGNKMFSIVFHSDGRPFHLFKY